MPSRFARSNFRVSESVQYIFPALSSIEISNGKLRLVVMRSCRPLPSAEARKSLRGLEIRRYPTKRSILSIWTNQCQMKNKQYLSS